MGTATDPATGYRALARPALRPGLHAVRRDDGHLQLGLDAPERLVLPDRPGLLEALTAPTPEPGPALLPVLDRLVADGWVVDAQAAAERVATRAALRPPVVVDAPGAMAETVARACTAAGLRITEGPGATTFRLVATLGEPPRRISDALVRDDAPHVFVAVQPYAVRVGPLVDPGRTPCLRCIDAHLGERDPRRATVLHQLERLGPASPESWDAALAQLGCSWAARDAVRRLDGESPALRAATVTVTDDLRVVRDTWLRHPHCGCAWG